ncbi:MAG TPA: hypothetical protein VLT33_03695 [Labilithrix sp.]|nr:hypothetical protein [Labilithrix sp.]
MQRSTLSGFSYLCLFAAAAASLATSQPAPDWVIEDTATGEVTLTPDIDETFVHLRVSSHVVSSHLSMEVALDPPPPRPISGHDSTNPILLFVGPPTVVTPGAPAATTPLAALPAGRAGADGFETTPSAEIPIDTDEALDIRITWKPSSKQDRLGSDVYTQGSSTVSAPVERPLAPRQLVKIRWKARLHIEGYGDRPAGVVVVEPAS